MAVSIVRGPDGRQHEVQHPDGIASSQIIKYAQREIASVANAEDSFVVDVGKGLFTGGSQAAVSSAAGVTQWMGQSFGSDSLLQAAEDMRQYSQGIGDQVGLDEDFRESFFGQVVQGLGQVPVTIGAGAVGLAVAGPVGMYGAAALTTGGQMTSEFLTDMEQTIGKQYTDFDGSEKEAALKGMLAQTALGTTLELAAVGKAVRPLLRRLNTKGVSAKALKKAIEQDKSALREIVESGLAEGFTEASQGQSLDTLASMLYDEDRELITMDTLKRRSLEFGVGAVVGGTVSGGAQILGSPGKTSTTNKDLGKPVEGRSEVSVPREIQVTYKPVDGPTTTVTLAPDEGESAIDAAERILEGRRLPGSDMTVNEVIEQTPIDVVLGEPDAEILEEDVPVEPTPTPAPDPGPEPAPDLNVSYTDVIQDPEYLSKGKDIRDKMRRGELTLEEATNQDNALRRNIEARISREQTPTPAPEPTPAPAPEPAPGPGESLIDESLINRPPVIEQDSRPTLTAEEFEARSAPEPSVETAPESEVDTSTGLPRFSLPRNLRQGQPRYKESEPIKFASDLERAAYSATTPTRSEPAKRKRDGYRKLLEDDGYTSTEINTMGREIRSQMREQYENPGDELSVALPQDLVSAPALEPVVEQAPAAPAPEPGAQPQSIVESAPVTAPAQEVAFKIETDNNPTYDGPGGLQKKVMGYKVRAKDGKNYYIQSANYEQVPDLRFAVFDGLDPYLGDDVYLAGFPTKKAAVDFLREKKPEAADIVAQAAPLTSEQGSVNLTQNERKFFNSFLENQANREELLEEVPSLRISEGKLSIAPQDIDNFSNFVTAVGVSDGLGTVPPRLKTSQFYQPFLKSGAEDIVAQAAPFTAPQKAPLSHVEQSDIIDMDALVEDIVENDIPVWFWYADQLGEGDFNLPSGGSVNLDAGPSFALQPANRAAGRVWASSKSATAINNKISQLKYTDKNGKEQTGYIFLVSGSPDTMFLFNKQAFLTFYQNAFQEKQDDGTFKRRNFSDVKKEILASRPTKVVKETLNNHSTLESLMDSAASRPFIEALLAQRGKSTPLAEYLKSKGFFDIENSQLRDGFYKDNNFKLNDVLLVVKPTKAVKEKIDHKTYTTPVYGEVVGVPDKAVDAYLLMPDSVRKNKEITMDPPQAAQVVAPYGARVTTIKKIVGSQQARRAVKKLRKVIEDSPDGFTVDTAGEFATGGYIVAPDKATEQVIDKENFNEESLTQYIIDNKPHLNVEGAMLGGWYDSQNGRYVLDVVFAVDTEQDAVDIAVWGDQDAIFNLDTFTEIRTKDDNKNPTTPQGDTRTASEILSRKPTQNLGEYSSQRRRDSRGVRQAVPGQASPDVTAQAAETAAEDRGPQETFDNINQLEDFISKSFSSIADKMGINIYPNMLGQFVAQYNVSQKIIEYNPRALLNRTKAGVQAAMREEIIHAAMHSVLIQKEKKARTGRSEDALWVDFFTALGNNLTPQERAEIQNVYQSLQEGDTVGFGSEYSRAVVQKFRYGDFTEQYIAVDKGGPAFQAIVDLLRSVQAYMAKVLGPMVKTDPEAAQVIVDTVELLNAIDPSIRPKSQQVVANAYNATDKNTAEENTDPGESVDAKASERIREDRKWFADSSLRKTASKFLTPVITRLNRINPMFGRLLQNLDTAIRERSFRYRKQTEPFFNRLNAIKGAEFEEMKQLLFFSPTPEEASRPRNKAKMQRRDALLHKYGLLNMYRLDVQPIMEEIYAEYTALGMPAMGYLEDYFPRVVKDLEGLIKSYGQKTKRTFELLVEEENKRRSNIEESKGGPLPAMEKTELARFFQDFLQNKFRVDINGARLPGNVKVRDIQLIPADKLKFYDNPGIAFGKYTANMARAIESFKVVGDTRKGRLQGKLGELTEELFSAGQIDQADAGTVKSLTELITTQLQTENEILKSLGTLTYMATLINPGPVLVQIMDLYKVALYRGLGGVVSGVYRTVTGNRRFDIEDDFSIAKTQLSAEFQDPSVLQKALDFGLSRLVPFRQMDTAMKHASIEAAYDDFAKKAKAPVGSKKYEQLLSELTITMGREDALKTISDLQLGKAMESTLVKEALLAELLQRQPLTYLQVPEGYQTDPSKRLFYKLSTFMLLDLNYNRQEFMNDLGGPGKTLQQRTVALRRLAYMATLLTMFGLPSDMLDDWISGKDTYIPEHVMNNMLGMFGLSKYTTTRALEKGTVESVIQRFTPPAVNIIVKSEESLRSWVKGDVELFEMKAWRNSPLSDVWYNRTGAGKKQQEKLQKLRRKEGVRPSIDRS